MIVLLRKDHFCRFGEYSQRNLIKLYKGNLKKISQFFEGNFDQNKAEKDFLVFESGSTDVLIYRCVGVRVGVSGWR